MESQKVWVQDVNNGYVLAEIIDIGPNGLTLKTFNNKVWETKIFFFDFKFLKIIYLILQFLSKPSIE
jgi:hypothetical protein